MDAHRNEDVRKRMTRREREKEQDMFFFESRVLSLFSSSFKQYRTSEGQVENFCLIIRDLYICNETCTYVDGRICEVSSACIQYRDQRKRSRMFKTAQGNCEIIRFSLVVVIFFLAGWEKEIKLTISFCIHTHTYVHIYTYRVYVNIWYSVSPILPFDNDRIGTIIFRSE